MGPLTQYEITSPVALIITGYSTGTSTGASISAMLLRRMTSALTISAKPEKKDHG
eukprot:SM000243S08598  [mRNA]  locus=s243:123479:124020:- [translate_table: standard]